jgi:hypothetical protein
VDECGEVNWKEIECGRRTLDLIGTWAAGAEF